jgi:hypothetical protein
LSLQGYGGISWSRTSTPVASPTPTIDFRKISKRQNLVEGLDFASGGDVKCFGSIVPVTDIRSNQSLGQEDCEKDPDLHGCVRREADCYTSAVGSEILCKRII